MVDEQFRAIALPLAVSLVNNEPQRVLGNCNTQAIAAVTAELVNILKFGQVQDPNAPKVQEPVVEDVSKTRKKAKRL